MAWIVFSSIFLRSKIKGEERNGAVIIHRQGLVILHFLDKALFRALYLRGRRTERKCNAVNLRKMRIMEHVAKGNLTLFHIGVCYVLFLSSALIACTKFVGADEVFEQAGKVKPYSSAKIRT